MIAARLLAVAGSGGAVVIPYSTEDLTASGHGGWTQKPKARSLYYNGHTLTCYIADDGDVEVVVDNGTPIVLHAAFQVDTHAAPAMLVRSSDGKLVVHYSTHDGTAMKQRISTNSLDSDPTLSGGFAAEGNAFTASDLTYPMLFERTAESGSPLYNWHRSGVALAYRKSTDGGATWGAEVQVYNDGTNRTYWDIALDPNDQYTFHFVVTDTTGTLRQLGSIRHFYADTTGYHTSDGTLIDEVSDPIPFTPASLTLVYDEATDGAAWSHDLYVNATGPVFIMGLSGDFALPGGGTDTEYRVMWWDGAWNSSTVLSSGGAGQFDPMLSCLDAQDETRAYVTVKIAGHFELWRFTSSDGLVTWDSGLAITVGSSEDNIYPVSVQDHPRPGRSVLWNAGTYTDATSYTLRIRAFSAA